MQCQLSCSVCPKRVISLANCMKQCPLLPHKYDYEYIEDKHDKKTNLINVAIYLVWVINFISHSSCHVFHACYVNVQISATAQYHSVTETLCGKRQTFPGKIILVMNVQPSFLH